MAGVLRANVDMDQTNSGKSPKNSFSLLLSYFVAQYVLKIVV